MTHPGGVKLGGFEDGIAAAVAAGFTFSIITFKGQPLSVGRHLFVQDMPEVEELGEDFNGKTEARKPIFDATREPTIGIYTEAGVGVIPSSSHGGRHEIALRFVLRIGTVPETSKEHLEQLIEWVEESLPSRITGYMIRARIIVSRPRVFAREGDQHAYCDAIVRFMMVPLA